MGSGHWANALSEAPRSTSGMTESCEGVFVWTSQWKEKCEPVIGGWD